MTYKTKYQIKSGEKWITCSKAAVCSAHTDDPADDWLDYELRDGTRGLKRPGTWRIKPEKEKPCSES